VAERMSYMWKHGLLFSTIFIYLVAVVAVYDSNREQRILEYLALGCVYLALNFLSRKYSWAYKLLPFYLIVWPVALVLSWEVIG